MISVFRSLQHRNYRLYWLGQLISLNGTWMQTTAQAWLVYRLTGSGFMLGLTAFFNLFPVFLLSLFGGLLADHFDRRRLLLTAYSLGMVQAFTLAALTLSGHITPSLIIVLAFVLGCVQAMEIPARHSFIPNIVPREDMPNAIALNSGVFNSARFMGPSLAGLLVSFSSEGWAFLLNGFSFVAVLIGIYMIRLPANRKQTETAAPLKKLQQGIAYAVGNPKIRAGLVVVALASMIGSAGTVLMPIFARDVFGGGPSTLGWLLGALGLGATLGALRLAGRNSVIGIERVIALAGFAGGVAMLGFSLLDKLSFALMLLPVIGFSQTTVVASCNTLVQHQLTEEYRGRVMSIFSMVFIGLMPLGSLSSGALVDWLGPVETIALLGILWLGIAFAVLMMFRRIAESEEMAAET